MFQFYKTYAKVILKNTKVLFRFCSPKLTGEANVSTGETRCDKSKPDN